MEPTRRSWLRATLWIGFFLAAVWLWFSFDLRISLRPADSAPQASPLFLSRLDGSSLTLADLRGQVVVLNLWASWCGPCRREIPSLQRIQRDLGPRGLVVLGLNIESLPPERLGHLARELGATYPIVLPAAALGGTFEPPPVVPHTWLVDRAGRVRASRSGWVSERHLRAACEQLLDEDQRTPVF